MDDYRSRLIDESLQLKERLAKLIKFNKCKDWNDLRKRDKELLLQQQRVMTDYKDILEERLART